MKIGIYGGSFNPIHIGHENIIKYVMKEKNFDKIFVIPVGRPSHRDDFDIEDKYRLEMVEASCSHIDGAEVTDIEIIDKDTSYTYKTLLQLKKLYPKAIFYEIIGEDSAEYLETWNSYEKMIEEVKFLVLKRRGSNYRSHHKNIEVLDSPIFPYSATRIREAVKNNEDISMMVSKNILEIIYKNNLYRDGVK